MEKFPILMSDTKPQIQEAQRTLTRINAKKKKNPHTQAKNQPPTPSQNKTQILPSKTKPKQNYTEAYYFQTAENHRQRKKSWKKPEEKSIIIIEEQKEEKCLPSLQKTCEQEGSRMKY